MLDELLSVSVCELYDEMAFVCRDDPHLALVCVELLEMQQTLLGGVTEDV